MKDRLDQIRRLLNELEEQTVPAATQGNNLGFSAVELPLVIQEIVDDLQPLLTPYDAAFYWHLFRHSIAQNGNPRLRVSTRGLQKGVVKSSSSNAADNPVSQMKIREVLRALESIGAIRKEAEPNRDGTLYRVLIPDEIEACRRFRAERAAEEPRPEVSKDEIDFYNVRENRIKIYERDQYKCRYCGKQLTRFTATLDHVKAVAEGGDNSFDNLVTACLECNSRKHKRAVGDFLAER
jgi:5-methylcytosine-specific restriction endonuclease McrA